MREEVLPDFETELDAEDAADATPNVLTSTARTFPDNAALEDWRRSRER